MGLFSQLFGKRKGKASPPHSQIPQELVADLVVERSIPQLRNFDLEKLLGEMPGSLVSGAERSKYTTETDAVWSVHVGGHEVVAEFYDDGSRVYSSGCAHGKTGLDYLEQRLSEHGFSFSVDMERPHPSHEGLRVRRYSLNSDQNTVYLAVTYSSSPNADLPFYVGVGETLNSNG